MLPLPHTACPTYSLYLGKSYYETTQLRDCSTNPTTKFPCYEIGSPMFPLPYTPDWPSNTIHVPESLTTTPSRSPDTPIRAGKVMATQNASQQIVLICLYHSCLQPALFQEGREYQVTSLTETDLLFCPLKQFFFFFFGGGG